MVLFALVLLHCEHAKADEPNFPYFGAASSCKAATQSYAEPDAYVCLRGSIDAAAAEWAAAQLLEMEQAVLVVSSPGGSVLAAMDLGRAVAQSDAVVVVADRCYSSCANYLIPASEYLYVADEALIVLHGSPPRERHLFMAQQVQANPDYLAEIQSGSFNPNESDLISALFAEFRDIARGLLAEETAYFADIGKSSEHYLHRYWEALRNVQTYASQACQPAGGFLLVVGPDYLQEFGVINPRRIWWPDDETVARYAADHIGEDRTFILDMNLLPSWLPQSGFVQQADCLADFEHPR